MANIINADDGSVSGIAGIKQTADSSGALILQANGVNAISISNTAVVTISSSISGNGAGLTNINASNISSGTVATARLASGTANSSTYLRGDSTWAALSAPNNGTLTMNTSGTGISGSATFTADQSGNSTFTVASNANSANGASTIVARDSSGNFTANAVTLTTGSFAGGSNTAPSITFTGDTNTGIFSPAADTIAFTEGGVESMRIDASGNVGIGGASGGARLDVGGTVRPYSGSDTGSQLNLWTTGGGDGTLAAFNILFNTGANNSRTERMRIDSSGNVLVGRTSVTGTNCRLNVQLAGTTASGYTAASNAGISLDAGTATNGVINLVGGAELGVYRSNSSGAYDVGIGFGDNSNRILRFDTAGSERMRIASNGALGFSGANYGTSGQVLTSNGSGAAPSWQNASGQGGRGQVFTSSGTFTIPTGITSLKVTVVGGGGGGGGSSTTFNFQGGAGGGSGGAGISYLTGLTPGATISVTIGAGGAGGAGGNNIGGTGGSTSVSSGTQSITTITATGGGGGASTEYSTNQTWGNTKGGNAGACSGATMNFGGNPGHNTFPGGGADGSQNVSGGGGGSIFGGGGSGRVCNQGTGVAGQAPGAGGGGASFQSTGFSGGAGAAGAVVFEW